MPAPNTLKLIITSSMKGGQPRCHYSISFPHDQVADIFTNGLTSNRFLLFCDKKRVCSPPISLQGDVRTHVKAVQSPLPNYAATSPSSNYQVDSPKDHQTMTAKTLRDSVDYALTSYDSTKNAAKAITRFSHIDNCGDIHIQGRS
jgi:hypothetical protein